MAKNIDFMGAIFPDVPSVKLPQQGGGLVAFDDTTDATATADKILQGYTAYANGQKLTGTASGGITPSGTYSITSNGIYDIVSFASVDVNVSGGGSGDNADKIIEKTFSGALTTAASQIGSYAFYRMSYITEINAVSAKYVRTSAFESCTGLTVLSLPVVSKIEQSVFTGCFSLASIYLTGSKIAELSSKTLKGLPSATSIYVPASLVDSYKAATYWSSRASQITSYEG